MVKQIPEFASSLIRQVECIRSGVHEFILLSCEVLLPTSSTSITTWMRIERHPGHGGVNVILNKRVDADDTIQISTNPSILVPEGTKFDSRGRFDYSSTEDGRTMTLLLGHIMEMCGYFIEKSSKYACQPCYGGKWIGSRWERSGITDVQTALEVRNMYLQQRHATCCNLYGSPRISAPRSSVFGWSTFTAPPVATNSRPISAHTSDPSSVIYTTPNYQPQPAPAPQPTRAPPLSSSTLNAFPTHECHPANNGWSNAVPPTSECIRCRAHATMPEVSLPQSPPWETSTYSAAHHHHVQPQPHPNGACFGSHGPRGPTNNGVRTYTSFSHDHTRNGSVDTVQTCCSGASSATNATHLNDAHAHRHHQACVHQAPPRPHILSPSGSCCSNNSHEFYAQQASFGRRMHRPPTNLYNIPEAPPSRPGNENGWYTGHQPPPSNPSAGHDHCRGCVNHSMPQPRAAQPPPLEHGTLILSHIHPQLSSHSYHSYQGPSVARDEIAATQLPPQPQGRSWTQEVWGDQGQGIPPRTDSPGPMENNSVKMPQFGDYVN
ncbi:hypothetical protein CTheo_7467 [Ceratobasidium theobromae]|uniref:Uncharacterized protein n=1 Tax=Ceratobasidium theobromae TaxID=1582974 RepID=A0A5N5QCC9_9AGAM|nr:hypothetical protein CTheo_7467 [Ceratobasidium theobromae]